VATWARPVAGIAPILARARTAPHRCRYHRPASTSRKTTRLRPSTVTTSQ
jgi:hypothetical protein